MIDKERKNRILDNSKVETPVSEKEFCRQVTDNVTLLDNEKRGTMRSLSTFGKKELTYHKHFDMGFIIVIPACMR